MCQFFDKRGYPVSVIRVGHHRAQQIDWHHSLKELSNSTLATTQKENTDRIPFTLTSHPHNYAVDSIFLKKFKLLQTVQRPVVSFQNRNLFHSNATKT